MIWHLGWSIPSVFSISLSLFPRFGISSHRTLGDFTAIRTMLDRFDPGASLFSLLFGTQGFMGEICWISPMDSTKQALSYKTWSDHWSLDIWYTFYLILLVWSMTCSIRSSLSITCNFKIFLQNRWYSNYIHHIHISIYLWNCSISMHIIVYHVSVC